MLSGLGAFAGGLSDGVRIGHDIKLRQQYIDEQKKANVRDAELHQARMDALNLYRQKRKWVRAANDEITAGWGRGAAAQPAPPMAPGLSDVSAKAPIMQYPRVAGLSTVNSRASQPAVPSDEMIGKRMLTGNLLGDPDELTRMASIYKKHGVLDEMAPWMNEAYAAKKRGIPDALHWLLSGNTKKAGEILRKGGMDLASDPVPISENDSNGHNWRFKLKSGDYHDINIKKLTEKFFTGWNPSYISGRN
jgi:hypothetical protein